MASEFENVEKELFEMVTKNDIVGLQMLITKIGVADVYDENGMTPLQHAAYKGHKEMVQLLLDQGADVNSSKHEHKYTALHFAALNGNIDICLLLLLAGAKIDQLNTVSRTASQMAAFVGNHECVACINNFIPKAHLESIITTNKISMNTINSNVIDVLHKFIIHINVSPIRILIHLKSNQILQNNIDNIQQILKLMCINEMTLNNNSNKSNEILALKYHYLNYILNTINSIINKSTSTSSSSNSNINDCIELYIRKLLKSNESIDHLIKDCVREFPYRESTIFRQLISSLTAINNTTTNVTNNDDDIKPLSILICIINGQQYCYYLNNNSCNTCLEARPTKKCSKCKHVQYCDRECQRLHWFLHKKVCQRSINSNNIKSNTTTTNNQHQHQSASTIDTNEITSQIHNILLNK